MYMDVHRLRGTQDVQQLKMVQMVSQSQFFRGFYLLYLMCLPIYRKNMRNFISVKCNS